MAFKITTTGAVSPIAFEDLGGRTFVHPTTGYDLESEFISEEIRESEDVQNAINSGWITVEDENGNSIETIGSFDDIKAVWGKITGDIYDQNDVIELLTNNVQYFEAYSTGSYQSSSTTWRTLPLDNQRIKDDIFNHDPNSASNDSVEVTETDIYFILGRMSAEGFGSNSRTQAEARIERSTDGGNTWSYVNGTLSELYLRQSNFGATGTMFTVLPLNSGDKIRITFRREFGGGNVRNQNGGSSLTIIRVKGVKGDRGPIGAGSSIVVQDNGVTVGNGQTESINFNGLLSVFDNGNGAITVTGESESYNDIRSGLIALPDTIFLTENDSIKLRNIEENAKDDQDASEVDYTVSATGDWNADIPANVSEGLDKIAERVKTVESNTFGSNASDVEVPGSFSTSSTTWQPRASLNTGILPAGKYRVSWYYEKSYANQGANFDARVQLDNITDLKNTSEKSPYFGAGPDYWYSKSGFANVTFATNGVHTIDLDFKSGLSGVNVSIRNVRIEIWKIS